MKHIDPSTNYYEERYQKRLLDNLSRKAAALRYILQANPSVDITGVS